MLILLCILLNMVEFCSLKFFDGMFLLLWIELIWAYSFHRMQEAAARLDEVKKSIEAKMALRQSNLNPERPGQLLYWQYLYTI